MIFFYITSVIAVKAHHSVSFRLVQSSFTFGFIVCKMSMDDGKRMTKVNMVRNVGAPIRIINSTFPLFSSLSQSLDVLELCMFAFALLYAEMAQPNWIDAIVNGDAHRVLCVK